jgi:hypothetical protein
VPSCRCLQLGDLRTHALNQIEHGDDQGLEGSMLGSWVLIQHLSGEGVELNGHRLRVLHQLARSVVDSRAVRANSCQEAPPTPEQLRQIQSPSRI